MNAIHPALPAPQQLGFLYILPSWTSPNNCLKVSSNPERKAELTQKEKPTCLCAKMQHPRIISAFLLLLNKYGSIIWECRSLLAELEYDWNIIGNTMLVFPMTCFSLVNIVMIYLTPFWRFVLIISKPFDPSFFSPFFLEIDDK